MDPHGDTFDHAQEVIDWAQQEGLLLWQPSPHQLKIGPFNYWPKRQKFNSDELTRQVRYGFKAFQEAVLDWHSNSRE